VKSKQVVSSKDQTPEGVRPSPGAEPKLKSERVQLDLQLTERVQRKFREATGGRYSVGEVVTVGLDLTKNARPPRSSKPIPQEAGGGSKGGSGAIVEAGLAVGTPDHNHQPSTSRKEEDHEDTQDVP